MVILDINNSYSQVKGLTSSQFRELRELLSYKDDSKAFYANTVSRPRRLIDAKGNFPTGLVYRVLVYFDDNDIEYQVSNNCKQPVKKLKFKCSLPHLPTEDQNLAIARAKFYRQGIISMPTGTGKSMVIAMLINKFKVNTLIIVPNLGLKNQLIKTLNSAFGKTKYITVENVDSPKLKNMANFDMLIIDECHHSAAKTYHKLNKVWNNVYYRFFLTATPYRSNDAEQILLECIAGQLIYELSYKEAIEKKYIVPIRAYYIDLPEIKNDYYTHQEAYKNLVVDNEHRNDLIVSKMIANNIKKQSTLCLIKEIKHGLELSSRIGCVFANGEDKTSSAYINQFNDGIYSILVGTTGVLGEGIDTKPAKMIIIASPGKSKPALLQQIGRGLRNHLGKEFCTIILFRDISHKFLLRHFKIQCKIIEETFGVKVEKI